MPSKSERLQAQKEMIKKMRLEAKFRPAVKKIFARILKDFVASYGRTGTAKPGKIYIPIWRTVLNKHIKRTQKAFLGSVKKSQKSHTYSGIWFKQDQEEDDRLEALLLIALTTWRIDKADSSADQIMRTTDKNIQDSIKKARELLIEDGEPFNDRMVALTAAPILKRKLLGRVETILITETQAAAESTKLSEAETLAGLEPTVVEQPDFIVEEKATKTWITVGDKIVRPIHIKVNGQTVKINVPFIVNGQRLRHPGDSSLGATLDNTANCRCSAQYQI